MSKKEEKNERKMFSSKFVSESSGKITESASLSNVEAKLLKLRLEEENNVLEKRSYKRGSRYPNL